MAAQNPEFLAKLKACADQARDLLNAAHAVFNLGTPHVAYPLAIAAIEEIGKRNLLAISDMSRELDRDTATLGKKMDDHQQKLFWALFGGGMFKHDITKERFQELQRMAKTFHAKRLISLYVDDTPDGISIPAQSIDPPEVKQMLHLADALVGMAELERPRDDIPDDELENQRWFIGTAENPELRRFVFSAESMAKLAELNDVSAWVKWMRSKIDESKAEGAAIVKAEIERGKNPPAQGTRPKWKVRFRIQSASHSIRPNALTEWNRSFDIIKLSPVSGNKREIIVEVVLLDNTPIVGLFNHAWGVARQFVVPLNIATLGFWWWHFSPDQTTWFEKIEDLDNKDMELKIDQPDRKIDWGENRALKPDDMQRVKLAFISLPTPQQTPHPGAMDEYVSGLTYLAASDVHMPMEVQAFGHFLQSLRFMMRDNGDYKDGDPFEPAFKALLDKKGQLEFPEPMMAIIRAYDEAVVKGKPVSGPPLKMEYVAFAKAIADWYFMADVQPKALKRLADEAAA